MAKGEGFQGPVHHQTVYRNRSSPCTRPPRPTKSSASHNMVWVPKIPAWEKEFCLKIGLFEWEDFVEAKKLITGSFRHSKILEWDDAAAEEAFHRAKEIFHARINGVVINLDDEFNPDSYIDEIVWDADDQANLDGLDRSVSDDEDEDEDKEDDGEAVNLNGDEYVPDYYHIRIEDIKPTGWDVDVDEISRGKVLTGLIVGSDA